MKYQIENLHKYHKRKKIQNFKIILLQNLKEEEIKVHVLYLPIKLHFKDFYGAVGKIRYLETLFNWLSF